MTTKDLDRFCLNNFFLNICISYSLPTQKRNILKNYSWVFSWGFGLLFYIPVNSYGHGETVSSPSHTSFLGKLRLSSCWEKQNFLFIAIQIKTFFPVIAVFIFSFLIDIIRSFNYDHFHTPVSLTIMPGSWKLLSGINEWKLLQTSSLWHL